jgi:hypothetical protein
MSVKSWDVEMAAPSEGLPIAVLQCSACRTIIGDSSTMVYSCTPHTVQTPGGDEQAEREREQQEGGWVALSACAPRAVEREDALVASSDPWDIGCLYYPLSCVHCQKVIGKMYHSTPRVLDPLRDQYCFNWSEISTYCVGSGSPEDNSVSKGFPSYDELWGRINQITEMLLTQTERIENVEDLLRTLKQ